MKSLLESVFVLVLQLKSQSAEVEIQWKTMVCYYTAFILAVLAVGGGFGRKELIKANLPSNSNGQGQSVKPEGRTI